MRLLMQWDLNAQLAGQVYSLTALVHNALSKKKAPALDPMSFNPFRERRRGGGMRITPDNMGLLKAAAGAAMRRRR